MFKNALQRLIGSREPVKTYDLLRLQAKSYRFLKNEIDAYLKAYKISALDWMVLGLLHKAHEGLKFGDIAIELGVEPPFVTELVNGLEKRKYIAIKESPVDKRSKIVKLTNKAIKVVIDVEKNLQAKLKSINKNILSSKFTDRII